MLPRFMFYITHCFDISCTNGFYHMEKFTANKTDGNSNMFE